MFAKIGQYIGYNIVCKKAYPPRSYKNDYACCAVCKNHLDSVASVFYNNNTEIGHPKENSNLP